MAGANWRCTACDVYNVPAATACQACDTDRSRPPVRKRSLAEPSSNWNCAQCGTNNGRNDLSCLGCATGWKAATKKPAPKEPSPRKSAAKKVAAPKPTTAKKATAPRKTTTRKTTSSPTVPPRREPTEVFYPSAPGGYAPPSAAPAPPPPVPAPRYTPPPYTPSYRPPSYGPPKRSGKGKGCALGCLGLFVVMFLLPMLSRGIQDLLASESDASRSGSGSTTPTTASCPDRIAEAIPAGHGAELVKAFRTENKQITLCRTSGGGLYYYGEFSDQREPGIAMPAEETSSGFEARNDPYSYRIDGDTVTVYRDGNRIGRETLIPEPSPS